MEPSAMDADLRVRSCFPSGPGGREQRRFFTGSELSAASILVSSSWFLRFFPLLVSSESPKVANENAASNSFRIDLNSRPSASKIRGFEGQFRGGKPVKPTASTGFMERAMGIETEPTSR